MILVRSMQNQLFTNTNCDTPCHPTFKNVGFLCFPYLPVLKFTARSPESPPYPEPEMYAKAALIRLEGLRPGDGRPHTKNNSFECCGYCSSNSSVRNIPVGHGLKQKIIAVCR
jgi:hypothetical protein